jgi:hypothetical protein
MSDLSPCQPVKLNVIVFGVLMQEQSVLTKAAALDSRLESNVLCGQAEVVDLAVVNVDFVEICLTLLRSLPLTRLALKLTTAVVVPGATGYFKEQKL